MTKLILDVSPEGTARCLHSDLIPLQSIGRLTVRRASNVIFNQHTQEWEVWPERTIAKPLFGSPSRQDCLEWESEHFQELI